MTNEIEQSGEIDAISAKVVFKFKIGCYFCGKTKEFEAADYNDAKEKIKKDKKWMSDNGNYYHTGCFAEELR